MKWLRSIIVFEKGSVLSALDWDKIHKSYVNSIKSVVYPPGAKSLTIREKSKNASKKWVRNGVGYLRNCFLAHMIGVEKWHHEFGFSLGKKQKPPTLENYPKTNPPTYLPEPITSGFGNFDFVTTGANGTRVAIEWETGNISSSHRSMNKLCIALIAHEIDVGVLIVPSRDLYDHLTDRVGNIGELSGYLNMWAELECRVDRGALVVTVVEHDFLTTDPQFPYLNTGNDGRAAEARAKEALAADKAATMLPKPPKARAKKAL